MRRQLDTVYIRAYEIRQKSDLGNVRRQHLCPAVHRLYHLEDGYEEAQKTKHKMLFYIPYRHELCDEIKIVTILI